MKLYLLTAIFCFHIAGLAAQKNIKVVVDERVELITITQLLFDYPLVGKADIKYKNDVLNYFSRYKNESCVENLGRITGNNFSFVKPFNYSFHFSFPGFKKMAVFSDYENNVLGFGNRHDSLLKFNFYLKEFYRISGFHKFFLSMSSFYDSITTSVGKEINKYNLVQELENYYGVHQGAYTLVLSPLFIEAGMSTWVKSTNGNNLYSIIGPNTDSKVTPDFDLRWLIQNLVIHEFSHAFCNPLVDKYYAQLQKDSCLYDPVKKAMLQQGIKGWRNTLCELLTRANEIILVKKIFGKEDAEKIYNDYLGQKWTYLKILIPIFEKYQSDRLKFRAIEDIMPELIACLDKEAGSKCNDVE